MRYKFKFRKQELIVFILFFGFILFAYSILLFSVGLKNLDFSRNILKISYENNLTIYDKYIDVGFDGYRAVPHNFDDWYSIGYSQVYRAFIFILLDFIIIYLTLFYYIMEVKR